VSATVLDPVQANEDRSVRLGAVPVMAVAASVALVPAAFAGASLVLVVVELLGLLAPARAGYHSRRVLCNGLCRDLRR